MRRAAAALFLLPATGWAQDRIEAVMGDPPARTRGALRGTETPAFRIGVLSGQRLDITLRADNSSAHFNVTAPGAAAPRFNGSTAGRRFHEVMPEDGDVTVQVYLRPAAAQREEIANFTLEVGLRGAPSGQPAAPTAAPADVPQGGPAFWRVTGIGGGRSVNLRGGPSMRDPVIGRLAAGTVMRNEGCTFNNGQHWCRVTQPGDPPLLGWVSAGFLTETAAP